MVRLPRRTGASPVLIGSLVLAVIRWSLLLAATILIARNPKGDFNSFACVFLAVLAGLLAEVTVLPGLAVAGGALRSLDIRRRVGVVSALLQGVAVLYLILLALLFFTDPISDPRNVTNQRQPAAPRNAAAREAERLEMAQRIMAVIPVVCGIGLAYTWLHASLYSACRRVAGATSIPSPEPRT